MRPGRRTRRAEATDRRIENSAARGHVANASPSQPLQPIRRLEQARSSDLSQSCCLTSTGNLFRSSNSPMVKRRRQANPCKLFGATIGAVTFKQVARSSARAACVSSGERQLSARRDGASVFQNALLRGKGVGEMATTSHTVSLILLERLCADLQAHAIARQPAPRATARVSQLWAKVAQSATLFISLAGCASSACLNWAL